MRRFTRHGGGPLSAAILLGGIACVALLTSCTSTGSTTPSTLPVAPFCSIIVTETFINPNLREAMVSRRTDPATEDHFTRVSGLGGPKGNPALTSNREVYAVREAWLHKTGAALTVVRADAHPAKRRNSTDLEASSWSIRSQDAAGAWSAPFSGGSANKGNDVDDPAAGALTVPQLMPVGLANPQMFACVGGRTQDNSGRTTWLIEVMPPNPATSTPGTTTSIQDVIYGDDRFRPNAPGPLIGPASSGKT